MDTTVATTLSLSTYSSLKTTQKGKQPSGTLSLVSQTSLKTTRDIHVVERNLSLNSFSIVDTNVSIENTISLNSTSVVERKGFNYNIYKNVLRKLEWTTELNNKLATTSTNSFKADIVSNTFPKASTSLGAKTSNTSTSSKKAIVEKLKLYTYKKKNVTNSFSLNSQTIIDNELTLESATNSFSLVPATSINTKQGIKIVNRSLNLIPETSVNTDQLSKTVSNSINLSSSTFTLSVQQGFKLGTNLHLNSQSAVIGTKFKAVSNQITLSPSTSAALTSNKSVQNTVSLTGDTVVLNIKDIATASNTCSLTSFSDLETTVLGKELNPNLSLIPSTAIEELTVLRQLSDTVTLTNESIINTITDVYNPQQTLSLTSFTDDLSTKFSSPQTTISLTPTNEATSLEFISPSSTLSLTSLTEVFDAQTVKSVSRNLSLNSFNSIVTTFDTKDVSNFLILNQQSQLESITEFKKVANTISLIPNTAVNTVTLFTTQESTISLTTSSTLITTTDTASVTNSLSLIPSTEQRTLLLGKELASNLSLAPITEVNHVDRLEQGTTINLTPTLTDSVYATELLQPQTEEANNGWLPTIQSTSVDAINGTTPNDSEGISHFSVSSNDREITFDYGVNNLTFLGDRNNHTLKVRYKATSGLGSINLKVEIFSQFGITRRETYSNIGQSIVQRNIVLSLPQANSINYNDLQVRLTANTTDGSNKEITVTWLIFGIPEVIQ